jgi:hypothetical protein
MQLESAYAKLADNCTRATWELAVTFTGRDPKSTDPSYVRSLRGIILIERRRVRVRSRNSILQTVKQVISIVYQHIICSPESGDEPPDRPPTYLPISTQVVDMISITSSVKILEHGVDWYIRYSKLQLMD